MSAKDPLTCVFLKVKVFNLLVRYTHELRKTNYNVETGAIYKRHGQEVKEFFENGGSGDGDFDFNVEFYKNFTSIRDVFKLLKQHNARNKQNILETFSDESWDRLEREEKQKHQPKDCKGCLGNRKFKLALSQFPVKGQAFKSKAKMHGLVRAPLGDITNKMNEKRKEELIRKQTVKDIEENKKSTAVIRYFNLNQLPSPKNFNLNRPGESL